MKYFSRAGIYKASNVTFDPTALNARSYVWWQFVKRIGGKTVFNSYGYSNSTRKHQYKVRYLMHDLGIKIDRDVQVRGGLQNIKSLRELSTRENETLAEQAANAEFKRIERNKRACERRVAKRTALRLVGAV
jgi:hypothetical protein